MCFRRTVVSIPNGPSALAVKEATCGLARYAAISQVTIQIPIIFLEQIIYRILRCIRPIGSVWDRLVRIPISTVHVSLFIIPFSGRIGSRIDPNVNN